MDTQQFKDLAFFAVVLFSAIGYWIASGSSRSDYRLLNVSLGIALFFGIGLLVYHVIGLCFDIDALWKTVIAIVVIVFTAYCWKRYLAMPTFNLLRDWGVTTTYFGPQRTWDTIISVANRTFYLYEVELECGVHLISDMQKLVYEEKIDFTPDMITDEEGNVALIVTEIREKEGKKTVNEFINEHGMTEYTYVPASKIKKIKSYFKTDKNCLLVSVKQALHLSKEKSNSST